MQPIVDYVGMLDTHGRELRATWICVADELASAAELVTGKINRVPAALIRGYDFPKGDGSAREMVRERRKGYVPLATVRSSLPATRIGQPCPAGFAALG